MLESGEGGALLAFGELALGNMGIAVSCPSISGLA